MKPKRWMGKDCSASLSTRVSTKSSIKDYCQECQMIHPRETLDFNLTSDQRFSLLIGTLTMLVIMLLIFSLFI